jgi:hypothetical protein
LSWLGAAGLAKCVGMIPLLGFSAEFENPIR